MRNEEEDEEEEQFYESLDRIASSSCSCSTSNSDSDADPFPKKTHSSFPCPHDHAFFKYDAWISDPPASISERRISLLHHMGLASDSAFNRRSISSGHLSTLPRPSPSLPNYYSSSSPSIVPIARSKSHGAATAADPDVVAAAADKRCKDTVDFFSCSSSSSSCSVSVYCSPVGFPDLTMNVKADVTCNCDCNARSTMLENDTNGGGVVPVGCLKISNRSCPDADTVSPSMRYEKHSCRRLEGNRSDSANLNLNLCSTTTTIPGFVEESAVNHDNMGVEVAAAAAQVCTIKNLDNGKEFVLNEIREDGMWNKLKEVATGRQLTMEEFDMCVGHSPIVQELMRRQSVEDGGRETLHSCAHEGTGVGVPKSKKKSSWFKNLRNVASSVTVLKERSSDERDTGSEKGGRRSSSATDDSQDVSFHGPERMRVRQYGKSFKELSALYKSQELQAHNGSIWSIKFSCDGRLLASAGEDCVIHVWQVLELERKGDLLMEKPEDGNFNLSLLANGSPEPTVLSSSIDNNHEKKRRGRPSVSRKSWSLDHIVMPETVFALSDKPICSFRGHLDDVLDLSWSKSQHLLSSSMDKTVRLWHMSSKACLKIFAHSDYVTCIQFNPVDDRYFISGSLDSKVRIWSIPEHQVVDWSDLHEMVTAACYTPDGQGAVVGSYKGSCLLYDTTDNKLQQKRQINLQNKRKKAHLKKITGFQFSPGSSSEVLITSADSRIRVINGDDLVHKYKGFRNTNSQISASVTANGKYIISASEDSYVYVWKHEANSRPSRSKGVTVTGSYEHFLSQDVSVAIPWAGMDDTWGLQDSYSGEENENENENGFYNHLDEASVVNHPPTPVEQVNGNDCSGSLPGCNTSPLNGIISSATNGYLFDRISATWPEEKLNVASRTWSQNTSLDISNGAGHNVSAYGMVIVTAGLRGKITTFQNFGLPFPI